MAADAGSYSAKVGSVGSQIKRNFPTKAAAELLAGAATSQNVKVDQLLDKLKRLESEYLDVDKLYTELQIKTNLNAKKSLEFVDFSESEEYREIIDKLYEKGILTENDYHYEKKDEQKYILSTKEEIEIFKSRLEGEKNSLRNDMQIEQIYLPAMLNTLELIYRMGKTNNDQDEKLKEKINANTR